MLSRRQLIAVIILISMLMPVLLPPVVVRHQKKLIRKEVKQQIIAGIDHSELIELTFLKADTEHLLNWKHSREFEYRGLMFDIIEQKTSGDSVHYLCWPDRQETKLNRKHDELASLALNLDPISNTFKSKAIGFFLSLFKEPVPSFSFILNYTILSSGFREGLIGLIGSPPNPPPECP